MDQPRASDRLPVLLASPVPPPDHGGIANWTRIVRQELVSHPEIDVTYLDTSVRWRSATTLGLPVRLAGGSWQALRDTCRARAHFRRARTAVFHLCSSAGLAAVKDLLLLRLARTWRVPSVIHYRMGRLPAIWAQRGLEWRLIGRALRLADRVIVLDQASADCLRETVATRETSCPLSPRPLGESRDRVVKLPNMVEVDAIDRIRLENPLPPRADRPLRVVYLGQVLPAKGLRELVTACARLADGGLRLEIVGPVAASFRVELEGLATDARDTGWLQFHGPLEHDRSIAHLAAGDIFVLPSYTEGFPNAVLEAMACERPILTTTVGALPEILDLGGPGECGICVPPQDSEALTAALRRLLTDAGSRRELGRRARRRCERLYSVPVVSRQLLDLWHAVGGQAEPPSVRAA